VEKLLPKTGQAVINDLVSNVRDIHPVRKLPVGERLAALALNRTYSKTDVVCASPEYERIHINGSTLTVSFRNCRSLKTRDGKNPDWFEIAGADGIYHKADAVIDGTSVKLSSPNVTKPFAVRFAWDQTARPNIQNEAGLPLGAFRAGEIPERAVLDELVPAAKTFKTVYHFDPSRPVLADNQTRFVYTADNSGSITGKIKRVGYFVWLAKGKNPQYVFAALPPLDPDVKKLGVPVKGSGAKFQQAVKNVEILASNVPSVKTGTYAEGWVEFWDGNYGPENEKNVPGASDTKYDFGDKQDTAKSPGYGSMQLHIPSEKLTVFAFNSFNGGAGCDIGIGNNPDPKGHPDWTFSKSAGQCPGSQVLILAETE
jgi:sialate O-acetylesterase